VAPLPPLGNKQLSGGACRAKPPEGREEELGFSTAAATPRRCRLALAAVLGEAWRRMHDSPTRGDATLYLRAAATALGLKPLTAA
jgi:hypothetical protein